MAKDEPVVSKELLPKVTAVTAGTAKVIIDKVGRVMAMSRDKDDKGKPVGPERYIIHDFEYPGVFVKTIKKDKDGKVTEDKIKHYPDNTYYECYEYGERVYKLSGGI